MTNEENQNLNILQNKGISFYGDKKCFEEDNKTLIILGVARGGTSLISGTLHHLGIFTGERSHEPVFEDVKLSNEIENEDLSSAKKIIRDYNKKHLIWAYKRPSFINFGKQYHDLFQNPIYLVVFKDIYSIANRNNLSMKIDLIDGLRNAQKEYEKIINFISEDDKNYFMFSYEKIMQNKEILINSLIELIGEKNVNTIQKQNSLNFIEPNPKNYLDKSRSNRSLGHVEIIDRNIVKGWGKYVINKNSTIAELYVNGKKIDETIVNQEHSIHNEHGFEFDISNLFIENKDKIAVKLSDDFIFLNGSQVENTYDKLHKVDWFNQNQLDSMAEGNYQEADFLRDIAIILKDKGDIKNSKKIINKAFELRPNGPFIKKFKEDMENNI